MQTQVLVIARCQTGWVCISQPSAMRKWTNSLAVSTLAPSLKANGTLTIGKGSPDGPS